MLRKHDPAHVIDIDAPEIREDLTYEERPVEILQRRVNHFKNKSVPIVEVRWQRHGHVTWEREVQMRRKYPELFGEFPFLQISRTKLIYKIMN